jgi:two-component system OmpR family response regulator
MASEKRYLFLVDDEPIQNEMLKDFLTERFLYEIVVFDNGEDALKSMHLQPEILILDYYLNANNPNAKNGIEILKQIKEVSPSTQVIALSGQDKIEVAIDTIKFGAYDYVVKGESAFSRIENIINNLSELHKMITINKAQKNTITFLSIVMVLIILLSLYFIIVKPQLV